MHDLSGTVIAIVDDHGSARQALTSLGSAGFAAEHLHGDEGRAHLSTESETGIGAVVKRVLLAVGDEVRIQDRLDEALAGGASVVSVDVEADQAAEVALILEEHGGHDMWRLGEWSFNRLGGEGTGEG
ncbi:MAG: hypothetical protein ACRDZM_18505 [Acidimicrobiia bacterium]